MPFRKFKETVRKHSLIEPGDRVLVAFSAGPDSTVLLHFLYLFSEELGYQLGVAHFNHMLREEAEEEEEFCRRRTSEYDLPFFSAREDVKKYAKERGLNLEEAARHLRYAFLEEVAKREGYDKIATGHTLSDQAETLLYRMLRGSGVSGLSSIALIKEGKYIRPLLRVSRKEILDFLEKTGIPFIQDPSNRDLSFDRNWLRHVLIPAVEGRFPGVEEVLAREAEILFHEDRWIEGMMEEELRRRLKGRKLIVDDWSQPLGFKRRLIRTFLRRMRGNLRRINFDHIEHLVNLKPGDEYFLPGEERVLRQGKAFFYLGKLPPLTHYRLSIEGKGIYRIGDLWEISVEEFEGEGSFDSPDEALVTAELPLTVRNWRAGDRYIPLGRREERKLSSVFNSLGVPGPLRPYLPVFVRGDRIVWAFPLPVAEEFKYRGRGLKIKVRPLNPALEFLHS